MSEAERAPYFLMELKLKRVPKENPAPMYFLTPIRDGYGVIFQWFKFAYSSKKAPEPEASVGYVSIALIPTKNCQGISSVWACSVFV